MGDLAELLLEPMRVAQADVRPGTIRGGPVHRRGDPLPAGVGADWETDRDRETGDVLFIPPKGYTPPPAKPPLEDRMTHPNYRPNPIADHFDRRAGEEQDRFNKNLMWLPIHLGVGGVSMAQSRWPSGPVSRWGSRFFGLGNFGVAGGIDVPEMLSASKSIPEMKRAAAMWRKTDMPGSPDRSERMDTGSSQISDEEVARLLAQIRGPQVPSSR
jgi:hypothetical protein